jgi:hypothetical protein
MPHPHPCHPRHGRGPDLFQPRAEPSRLRRRRRLCGIELRGRPRHTNLLNVFSLDQFKGIETIFVVASHARRPDIEQILTTITGRERNPAEKPQAVSEPAIIPNGYSGDVRARLPLHSKLPKISSRNYSQPPTSSKPPAKTSASPAGSDISNDVAVTHTVRDAISLFPTVYSFYARQLTPP